jgi:hypothetical protein
VADDPRVVLVADLGLVGEVDPWSRATSTEGWLGLRSNMAILAWAAAGPSLPFAHSPINTPAWKLSVANVASTASGGSVGVSSATTSMPACFALSISGTMAFESLGVIRMPLAPAEIRFSIAWTCDSLSPSDLPANDCSVTPA